MKKIRLKADEAGERRSTHPHVAESNRVPEILALQRTAGNRATELLLQRDAPPAAAVAPFTPLLPQIQSKVPDWMRKRLETDEASRTYLLDLYAKLGPLWNHILDHGITWIGSADEMDFTPDNQAAVRADLVKAGYTDSFWAADTGDTWGLREPGVSSAGLHWRGKSDGKINVHIDLHPPTVTGVWHWWEDKKRRASTHTPQTIRQALEDAKVDIPVLSQQDAHGRLTVRLQELRRSLGETPAARASLDLAQSSLDLAGSILWNRETITPDQLKEATAELAIADLELDTASRGR